MNCKFRRVSAGIIALFFVGVGSARAESAFQIVAFYPESGEWADVGLSMLNAYRLGFENMPDGIHIEPLYIDCSDTLELSRQLGDLTRNPRIGAFLGGMPGSSSRVIANEASRAGIPYLIDCNSNDSLTIDALPGVFRIAPPSSDFNNGLVSWAATVGGRSRVAAVLHDRSTTFEFLRRDINEDLSTYWQGSKAWIEFDPGTEIFSDHIDQLRSSNPAVVWLLGNRLDVARFLRQCRQSDWMPYAFLVGNLEVADNRFISASEGAAEMVLAPSIWRVEKDDRMASEFARDYAEKAGEAPDWRAAACYSATQILAEVISDGQSGRSAVLARLEEDRFETAFGPVKFEDYGHFHNQNRLVPKAVQLSGNVWVPVWPEQYAAADYVYPVPDWRERARSAATQRKGRDIDLLLLLTGLAMVLYFGLRGIRRKS